MDRSRPSITSQDLTQSFPTAPEDYFIKNMQFDLESPAISSQYISGSGLFCLGCQDGRVLVYSSTKKILQYNLVKDDKSPVTCISSTSPLSIIKNTVMVTHSGGTLEYWHTTSNQVLFQKQYHMQLQSCQISPNCQWYVISGESGHMYLGHLDKGNPSQLEVGHLGSHTNRVFCIKWHPNDVNIFFSGGWDRTVFQWDVRTKTAVKNLFGYHIGGKSIDVKENQLLLGNNQNEKQLRIYDLKTNKIRTTLQWNNYNESSSRSIVGVNSCFFGKTTDEVLALTSRNQLRFFKDQKCLSLFQHSGQNVHGYSMSHSLEQRAVVATWSTGDIKVMSY